MNLKAGSRLRTLACGASIAALALSIGGVAHAQESGEVEEVVVTGFRASVESAIALKREEAGVVDAIKAEDIAKFPDNNLAESLQRIPGVAITRSAGEGRNITVRGLGPGSTRVRINGMEALTTTGGSDADGGANRARSFDFNVFASELFNQLAVRKTASAMIEEGSLGATVDLTTARPLDFKRDQVLSLSAQYGYNDLSKSWDPRFAGLASKTFLDGTLGVLISAAYSERGVREEGFNTVRWAEGTSNGGWCSPLGYDTNAATAGQQFNPGASAAVGSDAANCFAGNPRLPGTPANIAAYQRASDPGSWSPRIPRFARLDYDQERLGVTGSIQWQPSSRTKISLDYLYSDYKSHRRENYLEAISFSRAATSPEFGKPYMIPRVFETDQYGTLQYGEFDNVDIRIESREDRLETIFSQYTLSGSHELTDRLRVSGLLGTSKSSFKNPIQTTITFDRANQDGWIYDARDNAEIPTIGWGFDVTDPNAFTFTNANANGTVRPSEVRLRPQFVQNSFDIAYGDVEWELNDTFKLRAGAEWKKYRNDGQEYRRVSEFAIPAMPAGVTMASLSEQLTGFGKGFGGDTPTAWVVPNFQAVADAYGIYSGTGAFTLVGLENTNARGSFRTVTEESTAGYVQLDFDTDILPWRVRGDIGVRYVDTDVTSQGYTFAGGAPVRLVVDNTYDNWLPAANVVAEITPEFLVRAAAAKVMVRPGLNALNPGGTISTSGNFAITAGNPLLKPQEANTYDLSFEWYPGGKSLVALGFFVKDFKTDFTSVRLTGPYSSFGFPNSLIEGTTATPDSTFQYTTTINTKGGDPYRGFELNIQQPATPLVDLFGLPEWVGNFGALFNYTYVKGTQVFCAGTPVNGVCPAGLELENRPTNVSKNAYNVTAYYEDAKFSARVSLSHRSSYVFAVPSGNQGNLTTGRRQDYQDADWVPGTTTIDANIGYQLTENLRLSLEAINLTDEPFKQYNDTEAQRIWTNHHYGRQYYFGLRYSF
ncbi:TonB-dependent receptor [Phenylobacterium sp.]|uniref:TonB-dependent receptor n=1 Tax=Phenylobacterium sp. TaxID=1871053 RepID=UPI0035ADCA13